MLPEHKHFFWWRHRWKVYWKLDTKCCRGKLY